MKRRRPEPLRLLLLVLVGVGVIGVVSALGLWVTGHPAATWVETKTLLKVFGLWLLLAAALISVARAAQEREINPYEALRKKSQAEYTNSNRW